jgi:phosphoribosylformylglycinamidine synthase, purS protein
MRVIINVKLKSGVLDPAGKATQNALNSLGFDGVSNVRIGKQIVFELDQDDPKIAHEMAQKMCDELLANPVIEDYEIVI